MSGNWSIPRDDVINAVIAGYRRGWSDSLDEAIDNMIRWHYRGKSARHARVHLTRDVLEQYYLRFAGRTIAQQEIADMANTLIAEGWRLVDNETGYLWVHEPTHKIPSRNGGTFQTYADATRFVFYSQTRLRVRERANA
jgi:hypothetical protein